MFNINTDDLIILYVCVQAGNALLSTYLIWKYMVIIIPKYSVT